MRPLLHDAALVQDKNLIRPHHGGQAVGDHNDRAAAGQFGQGLLDQCLVLWVGKGGGLVQHHDGGVLQNGPGQGHPLLLPAGEVGPRGADLGVHALGQFFQDVPALGGHQRRLHLRPGGLRAGGPDIFQNGRLEQAAVLEDKGDLVHEHMGVYLRHIHAAHLHHPGGGIPEPGDQAGGGGFAAAGGPYQGHRLPRLHGEGEMGEGGGGRAVVGEAHVCKLHAAVLGFLGLGRLFQRGGAHDLVNAAQGGAGQHHAGGGKHDPGEGRGEDGGEDRVEGEIGDKSGKIAAGQGAGRQEQRHRHQEHEGPFGEGQVEGLGDPAHLVLVVFRFAAVRLNGLLESLEGVDRLLENLDHRDAPDVLRARLGHAVLGRLVLRHQFGVFAPHHGEHGRHRDHRRQQAGGAHPPVKEEHHHQHGHKQGDGAHDVRQVVGQQRFRLRRRRVQPPPDEARGVGVEKAQGGLHHVGHPPLADVGRGAEGRQVGAHEPREVQQNAAHRKREGQPAVLGDALRPGPVRCHGDQVPGHQPDAEVGHHAEQHRHRRQSQAQEGQPLVAACIVQQDCHTALLFFLH